MHAASAYLAHVEPTIAERLERKVIGMEVSEHWEWKTRLRAWSLFYKILAINADILQ